jgi:chaperonin cofactor prefoldin
MIRKPRLKLELKERDMNSNQLERLKKDSREIGHYLTKIKKLGKDNLVHSIAKKQEYLDSRILEIEEERDECLAA